MNRLRILFIPVFILFLAGCTKDYSDRTLTKIPQSDRVLYSSYRTVQDKDLGDEIGRIERTILKKEYKTLKDWESTDLKKNTKIYSVTSSIDGVKGNFFAYEKDGKNYLFYEYYDTDSSQQISFQLE